MGAGSPDRVASVAVMVTEWLLFFARLQPGHIPET
jgi:hypothetical protein